MSLGALHLRELATRRIKVSRPTDRETMKSVGLRHSFACVQLKEAAADSEDAGLTPGQTGCLEPATAVCVMGC